MLSSTTIRITPWFIAANKVGFKKHTSLWKEVVVASLKTRTVDWPEICGNWLKIRTNLN